jgi:hypothetical protein
MARQTSALGAHPLFEIDDDRLGSPLPYSQPVAGRQTVDPALDREDGIAEDVTTALSRYPSLFVIARNSCFTYKDRAVGVKQVGRDLGVRYVLEGSVRKAVSRIRVTAQLVSYVPGQG